MDAVDVVSGKTGKAIQIEPNSSRLVEARIADLHLAELRALPDKELRGLCERLASQNGEVEDFKYINYAEWMTIRTTNQSGRVQANYILIPAEMLFDCIKHKKVEKVSRSPESPIPTPPPLDHPPFTDKPPEFEPQSPPAAKPKADTKTKVKP